MQLVWTPRTTSLKRTRPGDSPQNPSQSKKTKKEGGYVCPICSEIIIQPLRVRVMMLFTVRACAVPGCRHCAGLPKSVFVSLEN